jgi:hypothetical protein
VPGPSWRDFKFHLTQEENEIQPKSAHGTALCIGFDGCAFVGWGIDLNYDADAFRSAPVKFTILTPDSHTFTATFDLDQLP